MDLNYLIHMFLNLVTPPFTFFTLTFMMPPFRIFSWFLNTLTSFFSEDVAGKVVVITGASSGIGEQLAYEYAQRGACLVLAARREQSLSEVAEQARYLGSPDVLVIPADVANVDDCRKIIDQTMNHFGRLDHLVNNAGLMSVALFEEIENIAAFRYNMDVNFWGTFYMTRFAAPYLRHSRGQVIALSSAASWLPAPRMSIYNASKAAIAQFFETLRVEFGSDIGITVVTPGFIESEMTQGKFIGKEGRLQLDTEMRDVQVGLTPVLSTERCAKAIVKGAIRRQKYVTEPSWFKYTYLWKVFWPEVIEYAYRFLYLTSTSSSPHDSLSKKLVDYTGGQKLLYPETIQYPAPKTE